MLGVVALALGATFCFSLSTVLKHHSSEAMPSGEEARGGIAGFVVAMVRNPLWLLSLVADAVGLVLQVPALKAGAISVVQPMLTMALVFALVMNHVSRRTPFSAREIAAAFTLVGGLVLFLWASGAAAPHGPDAAGRRWPTVAVGVVCLLLVVGALLVARRSRPAVKAAALGTAVAAVYACTAALIKTSTRIYDKGLVDLLVSWQLWTLVVAGATGMILTQKAFQAGPLAMSLPVIASLDPLFSIAVARAVYGERLHGGPMALTGEVAGLALLLASVFYLSRLAAGRQEAGLE